jgi:hypothetical protein
MRDVEVADEHEGAVAAGDDGEVGAGRVARPRGYVDVGVGPVTDDRERRVLEVSAGDDVQ